MCNLLHSVAISVLTKQFESTFLERGIQPYSRSCVVSCQSERTGQFDICLSVSQILKAKQNGNEESGKERGQGTQCRGGWGMRVSLICLLCSNSE